MRKASGQEKVAIDQNPQWRYDYGCFGKVVDVSSGGTSGGTDYINRLGSDDAEIFGKRLAKIAKSSMLQCSTYVCSFYKLNCGSCTHLNNKQDGCAPKAF